MLNRVIPSIAEKNLPESQCGFRHNRSTVDMVFAVRQIQEKCIKQNMSLYAIFIDLTKAFDTVNREALWVILGKLGCPAKCVKLIQQFHDDMTGEVIVDGEPSERFGITNGVKQGCVLAPVLSTCSLPRCYFTLLNTWNLVFTSDTAWTVHCLI